MFRNLFSSLRSPRRSSTLRQRRSSTRLVLETLEDRTVPSTLFVGGDHHSAYTQIQDAVDAANPGDKIIVASGTYAPFTVTTDNLTIQKATPDANPVIAPASTDSAGVEIDANSVTVRGLEVGNVTTDHPFNAFVVNGSDNTLSGNTAENIAASRGDHSTSAGFVVGGNHNTVSGNTADNITYDGYFVHAAGFSVEGNHNSLSGNTAADNVGTYFADGEGIRVTGVDNTFRGNVLTNNGTYGVYLQADGPNTLLNNIADGSYECFSAHSASHDGYLAGIGNTFIGNVAKNGFYGFECADSGDTLTGNLAQNNRFGFSVGSGSTVTGNQAVDNSYFGFYLGNRGDLGFKLTVRGNVAQNDTNGFFLYIGTNATLTGNKATDCSYTGFRLDRVSDNTLVGNKSTNSGSYGFYLDGSTNITLTANKASDSGSHGFYLKGAGDNTLQANSATGNGGDGFRLESYASAGFFGGVSVRRSDNNVLQSNLATNNAGDGFDLIGSAGNMLKANHANNNQGNGFTVEKIDEMLYPYFGSPVHVVLPSDNNQFINDGANDNDGWGFFVDQDILDNLFEHDEYEGDVLGGFNL